jgi:hypothetical protein
VRFNLPEQTLEMIASSLEYKITGLQRILVYKDAFNPIIKGDENAISKFINLFCEYQLADNNYMNIHFEANANKDNDSWFNDLSIDQVLQFITYIIWTDKLLSGYMHSKIADCTMHRLLARVEVLYPALILSSPGE